MNGTLTDIEGILVGHAHDLANGPTGCTVVICPPETVGGVSQMGGAPGTRETDLLRPMHMVEHVNAILLGGGSAYGLAAADGVMHYLEAKGIGHDVGIGKVPIVPSAILYDLDVGNFKRRPDAAMGRAACEAATHEAVQQGSVGAGAGAKVGAALGPDFATKSGIGSASVELGNGLKIAALIAVNALGDVLDENGLVLAGIRQQNGNSLDIIQSLSLRPLGSNTVIGVVATNAKLTKEETNKMAHMAQDGLARAVRPAHTPFDGDTLFGLATGEVEANFLAVGAFAAEVTSRAIRNAVINATSLANVPAMHDFR